MNITWLIGNGFDIKVGLKTKYTDFYKSPYLQKHKDNMIYKNIIDAPETWADLELAIGNLSKDITESTKSVFLSSIDECISDFRDYLSEQEDSLSCINPDQMENFWDTLIRFYDYLNTTQWSTISYIKSFRKTAGLRIPYRNSFIVFNYTNIFHRFVNLIESDFIFTHSNVSFMYNKIFEVNIHSTIKQGIIIGCDNETQYNHSLFADSPHYLNKQIINEQNNAKIVENANRILLQSDIFVIFGMSIGATDKVWWNKIAHHTIRQANRRIIIFVYLGDKLNNQIAKVNVINKYTQIFLNHIDDMTLEEKSMLASRIIISTDMENIFNIAPCHAKDKTLSTV